MRSGIQGVVRLAESVKDGVTREVVVPNKGASMTAGVGGTGGDGDGAIGNGSGSTSHQFEEERKLAEVLATAFRERNEATRRYETIQEFMEKFDLSDQDSSLLENYNFDGILDGSSENYNSYSSGNDNENKQQQAMKEGMAFLNALKRVTKIRTELSTSFDPSSNLNSMGIADGADSSKLGPASAMRMVENLASKQDRAFERLYHFLHSRLDLSQASVSNVPTSSSSAQAAAATATATGRTQDGMDETLLHPFIRKSIVVLHQVPAYYKHTLELIATSRRAEVTRKFLLALTSGYDGMAPIEMKAHDPVNYVGDMLAFVFRTMSVESELAKGLFIVDGDDENDSDADADRGEDGKRNDPEKEDLLDGDESGMSAVDVLNDIVSGVARPLRSRLAQVTTSLTRRSEEDVEETTVGGFHDEEAGTARIRLASLYSICGLLLFYKSAMEKAAKRLDHSSSDSTAQNGEVDGTSVNPLVACLNDCIDDVARAYVLSLKVHIATLDSIASISGESQASVACQVITRVCDVKAASPGYGIESNSISDEIANFLSIEYLCNTIFDSVLSSCKKLDDAVTMKMALVAAKKIGLETECASKWESIISKSVQTMVDEKIVVDTKDVLEECGLLPIQNAIESMRAVHIEGMVASSHAGLSQESLQKAIKSFYASLFDPPIPSYTIIKDPVLRKYARNKVADNITEVYRDIYELIKSEEGGYDDTSFLSYDASQVKSMLSS
jgi:hypothetical protein